MTGLAPKTFCIFILNMPKSCPYGRFSITKIATFVFRLQFVLKMRVSHSLFYFKTVWILSAVSIKNTPDEAKYVFPVETLMVSRRGTSRSSTRNWSFPPVKSTLIFRSKVHIHPLLPGNMQEKVHIIHLFMHFFLYLLLLSRSVC